MSGNWTHDHFPLIHSCAVGLSVCVCATGFDRVAKSLVCDSSQSEGITAGLKPNEIDHVLHVLMRLFLGKLMMSL
jgi:hypothetical protein